MPQAEDVTDRMFRTLEQLSLTGRRLFLRADLDVPLDGDRVVDDSRLRALASTVRFAVERGAKVVLAPHASGGRSVEPAAAVLAGLVDLELRLADDCVGDGVRRLVGELRNGEVVVLENLRRHRGEETNDPEFARELCAGCEVYVNDAFSSVHTRHASVVQVPALAKERCPGPQVLRELEALRRLTTPEQPFVAVLGGPSLSTKARVLENLLGRIQVLLVGGGMAYAFLAAQGASVGRSAVEQGRVEAAGQLLERAARLGVKVLLPVDHACADEPKEGARRVLTSSAEIPSDLMGLDLGPTTVASYQVELARARTVFWNGPLGRAELPRFAEGTRGVAQALAGVKGTVVVGGADTAAALAGLGLLEKVGHVSTGAGASLDLGEVRDLPGLKALD